MNYELEINQSKPAVFNSLNGGVPPLVSGSGSATLLTTSNVSHAFHLFEAGYENSSFSLEVWWLPLSLQASGTIGIIGHGSEGILWDGKDLILRVSDAAGPAREARWTPLNIGAFHLVMTYTPGSAQMYVNGKLRAALDLEGVKFVGASSWNIVLHAGSTAAGIYDSMALYTRALSHREIEAHYRWGNDVPDSQQISMLKGGTTWSLSYADVPVAERFLFDESNFVEGYTDNIMVVGNMATSTTGVGTWRQSIVLSTLVGTTLPGIHLTYEGQGVTMSYSLDGTTWTPVVNKTTVLQDAAMNDDIFFVQLELADENSWVSSLRVDVLEVRQMFPLSGARELKFLSAAMDQTQGNQLDYHFDYGAVIRGNGYVEVQIDEDDSPVNVGTIEMWAKIDDTSGFFIGNTASSYVTVSGTGYTFAGMTAYRNGVPFTSGATFPAGQFAHWVFVLTTPNNSRIRVGNNIGGTDALSVTLGSLAVYPQQMTVAQVKRLYDLNVGAPALRVDDSSAVIMSESDPAVSIYAYSWSYVSGGR